MGRSDKRYELRVKSEFKTPVKIEDKSDDMSKDLQLKEQVGRPNKRYELRPRVKIIKYNPMSKKEQQNPKLPKGIRQAKQNPMLTNGFRKGKQNPMLTNEIRQGKQNPMLPKGSKKEQQIPKLTKGSKEEQQNPKLSQGSKKAQRPRKPWKRRPKETFQTYIHHVLKDISPQHSIRADSLKVMDDIVGGLFEKIWLEAAIIMNKRVPMLARDVDKAADLLLQGELRDQAKAHGKQAIKNYYQSFD